MATSRSREGGDQVTRTKPCTAATRTGRLRKANQFFAAAEDVEVLAVESEDVTDACATLHVHAGIAAADAICCAALGEHAQGENHQDAIALLAKVDRKLSRHLSTLLSLKTQAGYAHTPITTAELKRASRAAGALVAAARERR